MIRRGRVALWLAVGLLLAATVILLALMYRGIFSGRSNEELQRIFELKNASVAHLENFDVDEAVEGFTRLASELPDEVLPLRNLTIARIIALYEENLEPERAKKLQNAAKLAAESLMDAESQSADSIWLAYRYLTHHKSGVPASKARDETVISLMQSAEKSASQDPRYPFAIFQTAKISREAKLAEAGTKAIGRAFRLDPKNLHLLGNWLVTQAKQKDATIVETIESAREALRPLRQEIIRTSGDDVLANLDQAEEAVKKADWDSAYRQLRFAHNLFIPLEVAKRDLAQLEPHELESTLYDFSDNVKLPAVKKNAAATIPVSFKPQSAQASLAGAVVDILLVDCTQDHKLDLLVLRDNRLDLLVRNDEGAWEPATSFDVPSGAVGMLVADLDRDDRKEAQGAQAKAHKAPHASPSGGGAAQSGCADESPVVANRAQDAAPAGGGAPLQDNAPRKSCHEADVDVIVYGAKGAVVLRNMQAPESEKRWFEQVEQDDKEFIGLADLVSGVLIDIDHDADLDIVFSSKSGMTVWSHAGKETMKYVAAGQWSALPPADVVFSDLKAVDWDRDVDIDVMLADATGSVVGMLKNLRHGRLVWTPFKDQWKDLKSASSLFVLESDGNVSWDLAVASSNGLSVVQTATPMPGANKFVRTRPVAGRGFQGVFAWDYDNDGWQDLLAWDAERVHVFRAEGDGAYSTQPIDVGVAGAVRCVSGDIDDDGDLDLAIATAEGIKIIDNKGGNANHWLAIRAQGRWDNKGMANNTGVGSMIEIKAGFHYQAQVVEGQITHFGLGANHRAAIARIVWTNGVPQDVIEPATKTAICQDMVLKGSCPYLYTWDGERFVFHTDCLWAAPIGLQVAEGVLAKSRPWEYLRIPGEKLRPREGRYEIQLTEELWEIGYFEKVELIAIDRPADVEVYSNEKVGPPSIAQYKVHVVSEPRRPIAARDQRGRDVLARVLRRDGEFLKAFDYQHYQGLTEDHFLELDFGDLKGAKDVKLFLTGWIYPTDTSLNVSLSQNPVLSGPRFPSIWMPDESGEWREVIAYTGFPGGKTKTIVIDLSGKFLSDDHRVRIATNSEIYWDEAFLTVDQPESPLKTTRLSVASADLHYRGFSARHPRPREKNAPDRYDYEDVRTHSIWPPVRGAFTRYGDVASLLRETDNRIAVLGSGDEMTVAFDVPEHDPPPGWKRDFFLHCVGWDKDADLNTVYGQTVEPLPFTAMTDYPYQADAYPDSPAQRIYLRDYQNRVQQRAKFWRRIKNY